MTTGGSIVKIARSAANVCLTAASVLGQIKSPGRNAGAMLVSGSPRGGTTWVAESLAAGRRDTRLLWEPLQEPAAADLIRTLTARPAVARLSDNAELQRYFYRLFSGWLATTHLCRARVGRFDTLRCMTNGPLMIKFVRGNGIVSAVAREFSARRPLIVIRHPCAVVASQLKMGSWDDHPHLSPNLVERHPQLRAVAQGCANLPERLAVTWAADVLAARSFAAEAHYVYYEDVVSRGVEALDPVLTDWGDGFLERAYVDRALSKSSSTSYEWANHDSTDAILTRWQDQLSSGDVEAVLRTVRDCGVFDYDASPLPVRARKSA